MRHADNPKAVDHQTTEPRKNLGDLLIGYLEQLAVDYVFGIPGGAIEPLYDALARSERRGGPKSIVARHETGAAFMADGYSLQTGKLSVCCATTGPGTTNLITGVASAFANRVPMLVITAQTPLPTFGRGAFQESSCTGINTVAMLEYCTLYNTLISHVDQFEYKLITAIMTAFGPPSGPVHMSIPLDIMRSAATVDTPRFDLSALLNRPQLHNNSDIDKLVDILTRERPIVFVIGEGASESIGTILSIAHMTGALLLTTPHGKGLISPYHPQFRGVIGFAGHKSALDALQNPELEAIICVGSALSEWASNGWDGTLLLNEKLVHIDEQARNFTYTPMAQLHIHGHTETISAHLLEALEKQLPSCKTESSKPKVTPSSSASYSMMRHFTLDDEAAYTDSSAPLKPQCLMRELPRIFPPHTLYLADTGASFAWAIHYLHPFDRRMSGSRNARGGLFRACLEFASMGWAIGCAVGTALANRDRPVVCITGDGSMLMSGQEITVAVQEKLPVIFVVLNDSALGMVKHGQCLTGAESIGTEIPFTDFASLARSMGAQSWVIDSAEDLKRLNRDAICSANIPTLLDVRIDQSAVPPIGTRVKVLKGKE